MWLLVNLCPVAAQKGRDDLKESQLEYSTFELWQIWKICNRDNKYLWLKVLPNNLSSNAKLWVQYLNTNNSI